MFPPIPTWDGLHPLVVHFPIALLIVAPVFIIIGLVAYRRFFWFALAALVLMALGTIAAFVAVSTGEAGADLVMRTPDIDVVLERHEELAETTQWVFLGLTLLFAVISLVPHLVKRPLKRALGTVVGIAFLALYFGGVVLVANTAHEGGRLVHEFGVQALIAETAPRPTMEFYSRTEVDDEDDD